MRYSSFESIFRIPVWFAISNEDFAYRTWYWISLTKIIENTPVSTSGTEKKDLFRAVNIKDCITVG